MNDATDPTATARGELNYRMRIQRQSLERLEKMISDNQKMWEDLFVVLGAIPEVTLNVSLSSCSVDLSLYGNKALFKRVFTILVKAGFGDYAIPTEKSTSYDTFMTGPNGAKLWLNFVSTECRRVQVGVETKSVPVYEIQCGDAPLFTPDEVLKGPEPELLA